MTTLQKRIETELSEYQHRKLTKSLLHQTVLQCVTFGAAILTYHFVGMPPAVDDAYVRGYGQAYRTYCTGPCLNK